MKMKSGSSALLLITVILLLAKPAWTLDDVTKLTTDSIVNSKIDRIIDLSSQLVRIVEKITIEQTSPIYTIKLEPKHRERLAFLEAKINDKILNLVEKHVGEYEVDLTGQDATKQPIIVTSVYTKLSEPYPAEISQNERQLVRYRGIQTSLSLYPTKTITTRIKLPSSSRLESFTKASKMTTGTNKLIYGPFKDVPANQAEPLIIHYENNSPFVAVTSLFRKVELSPWAKSIDVVNEVKVTHVGAKLKGSFSRFEYQRDNSNGISSVRSFNAELPKLAKNIFFRDAIGNISTSSVRGTSGKTIVSLKPRFPLFGGWMTDFLLGYTIPLSQYLNEPSSTSNNDYKLTMPLTDLLYENMFIEDAKLRLVLPAGASNIRLEQQIGVERLEDGVSYSYLDIIGRPVILIRKSNVVAQHLLDSKPIVIKFNYSKLFMLQEPILLLAAFMIQWFAFKIGKKYIFV